METAKAAEAKPRLGPADDAARKRAAVALYARNETALRRTARRYSLCADDADDALQRSLEILLRKAPTDDPRELIKWTQTVVRHEALAVRRERERILAGPAAAKPDSETEDWVALLPTTAAGPPERAERQEMVARSREALQSLKPQELRALTLLAEGYSYAEIGEITGFSKTKINRCLAEGRERFRRFVAHSEGGGRCQELRPLLSAFCDGEARPEEVAELREHLRACTQCRATLRAYRAAPAAARALVPVLPLHRSIWERAQDAFADLCGRFGVKGEAVSQVAAGSGPGAATLAKVAVVCIGAGGGAAACVATGIAPDPLDLAAEHDRPVRVERQLGDAPAPSPVSGIEYEPAPEPKAEKPTPKRSPHPQEAPAEAAPVATESAPVTSGSAVEYTPPPAPEPTAAPAPETGGGSPAGEFGP